MDTTIDSKVFNEVLEILKYVPKDDYEKIPFEIIELLEDNSCKDYIVEYNPNLSLSEQGFSEDAKVIIAIFFRDYWATEKQKEKILAKEKYDEYLEEMKKQEMFNPDIFKTKSNENIEKESKNENTQIVVIEENNIFKKIILKIKRIFFKK